jgi:ADP-ribose pyrophosphatase YjhB (NUDIX family)
MADGHPRTPAFSTRVPPGDHRERQVCDECGWIHYDNPKVVVGSVATHNGRYLLCRRAIEPRHGKWTIPAGFLEQHETTEQGALREAREEACVELEIEALLAVYSIPRISQVQLIYKARLARPEFAAGDESLEVRLFSWNEIPWPDIAFPSVHWALHHHREVAERSRFAPFSAPDS